MTDSPLHILVLSDSFSSPSFKPRLRTLCDCLQEKGHSVHVVCEKGDNLDFEHNYPIDEVALYKGGQIDWSIKNVGTMLFNWKEHAFQRQVERCMAGHTYDLVFCTSFHTFPMRTANIIGAKYHLPVVIDVRDMIEQAPRNRFLYLQHHAKWLTPFARLYLYQNLRRRNRELRRATAITTVSPWHAELIHSITGKNNVTTIYNGYDSRLFCPKDVVVPHFSILYTGKVFPAPQQDPTLLFEAMKQLRLSPKEISIHWYLDRKSEALIRQLAKNADVEQWMCYHYQVPQRDIIPLLHEASICLVLTSRANDTNGHGKMTTKFFEALGVEKPVLCVESDEECLAKVIEQTNAGLSAQTADQVVRFILERYAEWLKNGYTRQAVVKDQKATYSRQEQAQQWETLFREIT